MNPDRSPVNIPRILVTAQYLGAVIMDSRLRGNDEIGQPPVIPAEAGIQWKVVKYDLPRLIENLHFISITY